MIQVWKFWWRKLESWNTTARTLDLAPAWQTIAQESDQTVARYWWVFFVYLICLLSLIGWYDLWCAGFQGEDPKTDFRGMGILGLQNLMSVSTWWFIIIKIIIIISSSSSPNTIMIIMAWHIPAMTKSLIIMVGICQWQNNGDDDNVQSDLIWSS